MISCRFRMCVLVVFVAVIFFIFPKPTVAEQAVVVGWLEKVYIPQYDFSLRGKMDSGAKNSSLHAVEIEYFQDEGSLDGPKVRFKVIDTEGEYRIMEAPLVGEAKVKRTHQVSEGRVTIDLEKRPVVELEMCLAGVTKRIQVNLSDRSGMNYRLILGRSALAGDFIVDVSRTFVYGSGTICRQKKKTAPPGIENK